MSGKGSFSIMWEGLGDWQVFLDVGSTQVPDKVSDSINTTVEKAKGKAESLAAVDTGEMKGSIHTKYPDKFTGELISPVYYTGFVEFGTRYMSAQPFMRPAIKHIQPTFTYEVYDVLEWWLSVHG